MSSVVAKKFLAVEQEMNDRFQERNEAVRGLLISTLSKTNILFLGSAGIAKSALVNQWNRRIIGGKYFSWLLTKFSTPEELFGPPSLKGLKDERYYRVIKNKLPEATTAFIDEVFKGNSSILNSMLTVLNERKFYNDGDPMDLDLVTVAGASNEIPDAEDGLDAFFDRFLLKYFLRPIQESSNFVKMISSTSMDDPVQNTVTLEEIKIGQQEVQAIEISDTILKHIVKLRDKLRNEGISVTDRTFKTSMGIIKAEAWLHGRNAVITDDLEIFKHICWNKPEQEKSVHGLILELISPEKNKIVTLYSDCLDLSKGVYKHKDAAKKQNALIEANKKIKEARVTINGLKKDLITKKQDTSEIEKMEMELERLMISMANDVLGTSIATLNKVDS
jgi:MoxR-like ATPase